MTLEEVIQQIEARRDECQECYNNFRDAKTANDKQWRQYWRGGLANLEQALLWLKEVEVQS